MGIPSKPFESGIDMAQIQLYTRGTHLSTIPVQNPTGGQLLIPRLQFRCWVRLPNSLLPRDGIIDTGSPFSWFPEDIWSRFRPGIEFEWLPFPSGYQAPIARTATWAFRFRMARMLQPITLFDTATELERDGAIVQFAEGNPPSPSGINRPAVVIFGLWGSILDGTKLVFTANSSSGGLDGALEF